MILVYASALSPAGALPPRDLLQPGAVFCFYLPPGYGYPAFFAEPGELAAKRLGRTTRELGQVSPAPGELFSAACSWTIIGNIIIIIVSKDRKTGRNF